MLADMLSRTIINEVRIAQDSILVSDITSVLSERRNQFTDERRSDVKY